MELLLGDAREPIKSGENCLYRYPALSVSIRWVNEPACKKVPKTPLPRQSNDTLAPARQHNQMRGMAGGLVCDAVSFDVARRRARAPGEGDQAAGANPYAFAGETYDGKLMSQLLIALE